MPGETVGFQCHQHGDGEAVVDLRDIDVRRAQARHLRTRSHRRSRPPCSSDPAAARRPTTSAPGRSRGWARASALRSAFARCALISTTAAAPSDTRQQSSRRSGSTTHGDSRYCVERQRLAQLRVGIRRAVPAHRDRNRAQLVARGPELLHVPAREHRVAGRNAEPAIGGIVAPRLFVGVPAAACADCPHSRPARSRIDRARSPSPRRRSARCSPRRPGPTRRRRAAACPWLRRASGRT